MEHFDKEEVEVCLDILEDPELIRTMLDYCRAKGLKSVVG